LAIYLTERGIDPRSIPPEAVTEMIETACDALDLTALRNSQAMVTYMGMLKAYSDVIAVYCTKPASHRRAADQVICDILKRHGVRPASE
jgi:hypothetical protein